MGGGERRGAAPMVGAGARRVKGPMRCRCADCSAMGESTPLRPGCLAAASLPNPCPERLEGPEQQSHGGQSSQDRLRDLAVRMQNISRKAVEAQVAQNVPTDGLQL